MSAEDDQLAALVEDLSLTQRGTVYTSANWATVDRSGLKCMFTPAPRQPAATGGQRQDLARQGTLEWERGYTMPNSARVEIDVYPGILWQVQRGTDLRVFGPGNGTLSFTAEVTRVVT